MTSYRIRAAALVLLAVLVSGCGSEDAPEWTPPQSRQEAEALLERVSLEPDDWGEEFAPSEDFYEHGRVTR
ncbi:MULTISPECIES: hypothetical protein [unclassified Streptomyces]|uniref:hypothetical protein n=1 Tax=unclassified Streptomyces TaxID=2593676 RepID=UPI0022B5F8EA|nr:MULTISPECIES: hypothetical protein [unclassified Streptomyces]MCZ7417764.1 hypothetical protein [Streptomyces sp. WMMC897]MCZ7432440.1 hypothetical protein [Streptomyces sp. WMMC1477]